MVKYIEGNILVDSWSNKKFLITNIINQEYFECVDWTLALVVITNKYWSDRYQHLRKTRVKLPMWIVKGVRKWFLLQSF